LKTTNNVRYQIGNFLEKLEMSSTAGSYRFAEIAKVIFVIMSVTFLAHFVFFPLFGIYEDDYILTLPTMHYSWHDFREALVDAWVNPVMARPLNHFLRQIFCFFTVRNGHLGAGYLLSWILVSVNGITLFALIRRILGYAPALIGALVFVLFPLDTSRQILMHQTDLLVPIFLLLVCFHLYLSGRYVIAYVVIALSFIDLESLFPVFLAAPLLAAAVLGWRGKEFFRRFILHATILGVLFALLVAGRMTLGDDRARSVAGSPIDTILRMVRLATEGPWHGLQALVLRPIDGAIHCSWDLVPYIILAIAMIAWALSRAGTTKEPATDPASVVRPDRRAALFVFIGGAVAWSLSYVLWIPDDYFPPIIGIGRLTGEHSAAAIGAGLVSASFGSWFFGAPRVPKRLVAFVFSCYCGGLVSFGVQVQRTEYVAYWDETKRFWSDLLNQIRDIQDGEVVLIEQSSDSRVMPVTKGFNEYDEGSYMPMALPFFVDFPNTWHDQPRVYGLWKGCDANDLGDSVKVHTPIWAPTIWPTVRSGNFIYFRAVDGRLERVTGSVTIEGKTLQPKALPTQDLPPLPLSKTYLNLISPPNALTWPTLRDARNYPR
jgi:hypothetical protein